MRSISYSYEELVAQTKPDSNILGSKVLTSNDKTSNDITSSGQVLNGWSQARKALKSASPSEFVMDEIYEGSLGEPRKVVYSDSFTKRNIIKLVNEIQNQLAEWIDEHKTTNEIICVNSIFKLVQNNLKYLSFKPETRLFLGNIQDFIINWTEFEIVHIQQFSLALAWFKDGDISKKLINSLSQEIFLIHNRARDAKTNKEQ